MASVQLRAPLRDLAGAREVECAGDTVGAVLAALEASCPALAGWVRDEQGALRRHVSVFVNDRQAGLGDRVRPDDRIHIVPAISGGAENGGIA